MIVLKCSSTQDLRPSLCSAIIISIRETLTPEPHFCYSKGSLGGDLNHPHLVVSGRSAGKPVRVTTGQGPLAFILPAIQSRKEFFCNE